MYENGLKLVGQLFKTNGMQTIITTQIKLRNELEDEFNIALTEWQYRSIVILTRDIRQKQKEALKIDVSNTTISVLRLLHQNNVRGCRFIKNLYDKNQRQNWPWGEVAKAYETNRQDNLITVTRKEYTKAYMLINKATAVPRDRWLSIQILNRTNWTNYKQYLTESNRRDNIDKPKPLGTV